MPEKPLGQLTPKGGGDPIPLLLKKLTVGRRETCDIILRFGNVSGHHCELTLEGGYWFVKDLNSRNGTRVNGYRVTKRRIDPGDTLSVGKLQYEMSYSPADLGAVGPPPDGGDLEEILGSSLLESAGLNRKERQTDEGRIGRNRPKPAPAPVTAQSELAAPEPADAQDLLGGDAVADGNTADSDAAEQRADEAAAANDSPTDEPDPDYKLAPEE